MTNFNLNTKIIAVLVTIGIIAVLFITGPAQAVILKIEIPQKEIFKGSILNIMPLIEIEDSEIVNVDYIVFELNGPEDIECRFLPNGSVISGCSGIKIELLNITDFGYGYGYLYNNGRGYGYGYGFMKGNLRYNLTIDSKKLKIGEYETMLSVFINEKKAFEKKGDNIRIKNKPPRLSNRCSIRAFDGKLNITDKEFSNNRISFYISSRDPIMGKGSLSGQKGRERFNYKFKIMEILENNVTSLVVKVNGDYRVGRNGSVKRTPAEAILTFDRIHNKIILSGDKINTKSMIINFIEGCEFLNQT